jgi:DNA-binding transcriptional LysR family regulator
MPDLNDIALFVRVVDRGGFAKVARELRVPTSTVSRAVARLEAALGTQLLVRSSRAVAPTAEGQRFHREAAPSVEALRSASRGLGSTAQVPRGRLRITAPNDLGASFLGEVVATFVARYPEVRVETILTTRTVGLVDEGVDVALRAAFRLPDSSLVVRKVGELERDLYASPAHIARYGLPAQVEDLAAHPKVLFRAEESRSSWRLTDGAREEVLEVEGAISSDDHLLLQAAVLAGAGVGLLPGISVAADVAAGRLVQLLPEWSGRGASLFFVHAPMAKVPARITAFRELVIDAFGRVSALSASRRPRP